MGHYIYYWTRKLSVNTYTHREPCTCEIGHNHWAKEPNE